MTPPEIYRMSLIILCLGLFCLLALAYCQQEPAESACQPGGECWNTQTPDPNPKPTRTVEAYPPPYQTVTPAAYPAQTDTEDFNIWLPAITRH